MGNPYLILGVHPSAPLEQIKLSWKRLALQLHPDRNSHPAATAQFKEVQAAWESLRDGRTQVDIRLRQEAERARFEAAERVRLDAERRAWFQRVARAQMDAELRREMDQCPRRDLYDVRFYNEPLRQPPPAREKWRGENVTTALWDVLNLFRGR